MLELQAGGECGLGDLDLLGRRLGRGQSVLQLVAGLREGLREGVLRVPHHPAEDLGGGGKRGEGAGEACGGAKMTGSARGEAGSDRGGGDQRADEVRAAALVLLRRKLAVLVGADRNVLGTVVRG